MKWDLTVETIPGKDSERDTEAKTAADKAAAEKAAAEMAAKAEEIGGEAKRAAGAERKEFKRAKGQMRRGAVPANAPVEGVKKPFRWKVVIPPRPRLSE